MSGCNRRPLGSGFSDEPRQPPRPDSDSASHPAAPEQPPHDEATPSITVSEIKWALTATPEEIEQRSRDLVVLIDDGETLDIVLGLIKGIAKQSR